MEFKKLDCAAMENWHHTQVRSLLLQIQIDAGNDGERALVELSYWARKLCKGDSNV